MGTKSSEIIKAILKIMNDDGSFSTETEIPADVLKEIFDLKNEDGSIESDEKSKARTIGTILFDEYQEYINAGFNEKQAFELLKVHTAATWGAVMCDD